MNNLACPNCLSVSSQFITIPPWELSDNAKMIQCDYCGTRFNPGDMKEEAEVPEDVNTPEKLVIKKQRELEAEQRFQRIISQKKR